VVYRFCCPVVLLCRHQRRQRVLPSQPWLWLLHAGSFVLRSGADLLCAGPDLLRSGSDLLCPGPGRRGSFVLRSGPGAELLRSGPLRCPVVLRSGPELWLWLQ
jgi:hypothetical protein